MSQHSAGLVEPTSTARMEYGHGFNTLTDSGREPIQHEIDLPAKFSSNNKRFATWKVASAEIRQRAIIFLRKPLNKG